MPFVEVRSQVETILCGRISCEGLEGRLNENSMLSRAACFDDEERSAVALGVWSRMVTLSPQRARTCQELATKNRAESVP